MPPACLLPLPAPHPEPPKQIKMTKEKTACPPASGDSTDAANASTLPQFLRSVHTPDADPQPVGHTQPIPCSRSECARPHKTVVILSPHEAPKASRPALTEPCSGPFASSFLPPGHTLPSPAPTSSSTPQNTQKPHNRLNPPVKVGQMKLLIGRMKVIIRQSKPHHHCGRFQLPHKVTHNRNRTPATHKYRLLAKNRAHRLCRSLHICVIRTHHNRIARMDHPHLEHDSLRRYRLHISLVLRKALGRGHIRHQPHTHFRHRLGRNHRLRPRANKPTGHPMYIERRSCPRPLQHTQTRFPG